MANLVKDVKTFEQKIFKISGPLGKLMSLKVGTEVKAGQLLSYNELDGKLEVLLAGKEAFTVALESVDNKAAKILIAVPGTLVNSKEVIGISGAKFTGDKAEDYKIIKQLWSNGITLEEVK